MTRELVAIAVALAIVVATTTIVRFANGAENDDLILPPKRYDKPFRGNVVENTARDKDDLTELCWPNPLAAKALGCSIHFSYSPQGPGTCYIYIADEFTLFWWKVSADAVRRHEIAHCLGWPADHPK